MALASQSPPALLELTPMRERILALVPGGIGDQILFFPTLSGLRQLYPQATIEVMVEPRAAGAYEVCPSVDRVLTFPFKEHLSLSDLSDLLGRMRDRQYDAVVSLGRSPLVRLLLWMTGIPTRVGYGTQGWPWLTHAVPLQSEQYAAHMYQDLLQGVGHALPYITPQIRLKKPALEWSKQERQRLLGDPDAEHVVLHPGASQLSIQKGIRKIYPVENWVQIIKGFRQLRPELPILLIAGPEDDALTETFRQALDDLLITRPARVGQLAGLIAGASLMLCTDSAPMHLAVATQTPVVALFGPTDPAHLLPPDGPFRAVRSTDQSIESISPQQVLDAIFKG